MMVMAKHYNAALMRAAGRFLSFFVVLAILASGSLSVLYASPAQAATLGTAATYDPNNPPKIPISPYQGVNRPYVYDTQVAIQIQYWGKVLDGIVAKLEGKVDHLATLEEPRDFWEAVDENRVSFNKQELKMLCVLLPNAQAAPDRDIAPNFPAWPNCGGVFERIFGGPQFMHYFMQNQDRLYIYHYWLQAIGFTPSSLNATLSRQANNRGLGNFKGFQQDDSRSDRNCKTPSQDIEQFDPNACGIFCTVTKVIVGLLNGASEVLVRNIVGDESTPGSGTFHGTILAALMLYISIYGAMVVLGFVNVALGDAMVRAIKVGVVAMLVSGPAMDLFSMLRCLFIEGTTWLINGVMGAALTAVSGTLQGPGGEMQATYQEIAKASELGFCDTGAGAQNTGGGPLVVLEKLVTQVFSSHMFHVLITLALSSFPYGFILFVFLCYGLILFIVSVLKAVQAYMLALIGQFLLLSLLPLFLAFLLFERTRHLFEGWINHLIAYSLAPVFLFAYISLFVVVIDAALAQLLDVKVCWDKWFSIAWVFDISRYHFYQWNESGPLIGVLPFGFFEVLIFVLLCYLMKEFENEAENIARVLTSAYVYINNAGTRLQSWFDNKRANVKAGAISGASKFGGKAAAPVKRGAVKAAYKVGGSRIATEGNLRNQRGKIEAGAYGSARTMKDARHNVEVAKRLYNRAKRSGDPLARKEALKNWRESGDILRALKNNKGRKR